MGGDLAWNSILTYIPFIPAPAVPVLILIFAITTRSINVILSFHVPIPVNN